MNVGQVLETHLGWVAKTGWEVEGSPKWAAHLPAAAWSAEPGTNVATPVFDGAREEEITGLLGSTRTTADGVRLVGETARRGCSTAAPGSRSRTRSRSATSTS